MAKIQKALNNAINDGTVSQIHVAVSVAYERTNSGQITGTS